MSFQPPPPSRILALLLLLAVSASLKSQGLFNTGSRVAVEPSTRMVVSGAANGNLTNASGEFDNQGDLYIEGDLSNDGTFINGASAAGTGRILLDGTVAGSGSSVSEVYYSDQSNNGTKTTGRWWYISPSVSNATNDGLAVNPFYQIYRYDETVPGWNLMTGSGLALNQMQGYATRIGTDGTVAYAGDDFYQGTLSVNLTTAGDGWNLIGNPYPCPLDMDLTGGTADIFPAIWVRSNLQYATYNTLSGIGTNGGSQYIATNQSFWVWCTTAGTFEVTNAAKTMNTQPLLKATAGEKPLVRLRIEDGTGSDEAVLACIPGSQAGYDAYDTEKRFGSSDGEVYFPVEGGKNLAAHVMPVLRSGDVPVGLRTKVSGSFTLRVSELGDLPFQGPIELVDLQEEQSMALAEGLHYVFSGDEGTVENRFVLRFGTESILADESAETRPADPELYSAGQMLHIRTGSFGDEEFRLQVFTLLGTQVYDRTCSGTSRYIIQMPLTEGIYLVRMLGNQGQFTSKLRF